jgi:hypothetical protein
LEKGEVNLQADWEKDWQPMINAIGVDFSDGKVRWGADTVEQSAIRRFLEPLEFDCPLHYDKSVANDNGYADIIAPYSSLLTWTIPPLWSPGMKIFTDAERDAQPSQSHLTGVNTELAPKTTGYMVTELEIDYIKPIVLGERLCKVGNILLSCIPKETKVGRGAFMTWESEIRTQEKQTIAKIRTVTYSYNPYSS